MPKKCHSKGLIQHGFLASGWEGEFRPSTFHQQMAGLLVILWLLLIMFWLYHVISWVVLGVYHGI
jgi:hypothetical protein